MKRLLQHPEDDQLFRYADGELPAGAHGKVRSHLEACWECRVELAELQETVGECVRYRKSVLQRHLPSPPAPWMDIYQRFSAIDASPEPVFFDRVRWVLQFLPVSHAQRWATAVVMLMVLAVLFLRLRQTPSVEAAELLRKAILAADARPDRPHRIQVRTKNRRLTRLTGSKASMPSSTADVDAINSLQALFQAANYDWEDPLSAKSYQAWRDQLTDKRDEVNQERDSYQIRTNTGSGELMQATLKLAMQDLRPVEGRFEFRNQEWVEIEEIPGEVLSPATTIAPQSRPLNPIIGTPVAPSRLAGPASATSAATVGDELHVLASLHAIGADLGDPIEISRAAGDVIVNGAGISPERQQQITQALSSLPHVTLRFSGAAPIKVQPERLRTDSSLTSDIIQMQARIAEQIGGRAYFDQLASQVLDMSEPMMSRAYALRHLAERFTPELESELSAEDRQLLGRIRGEHAAALRQQAVEMERLLKPVLSGVTGAADAPADSISPQAWQPATEEMFQSARRVEKLLAVMFGVAQGESSNGQLPSQLLSNLAQLRAGLDAYDHSTTMERRDKR